MGVVVDSHVHSRFSCDATNSIDEMCEAAIEKGVSYLTFLEHYDLHKDDMGYRFLKMDSYLQALDEAALKYSGRLTVLKGLEFGEPHRHPSELEAVQDMGFDVIAGSVHWIGDRFIGDPTLSNDDISKVYNDYWREVSEVIDLDGVDVLAHLDIPKRYLRCEPDCTEGLGDLICKIAESNKVLEVNTSSLAKGLYQPMPSFDSLRMYAEAGGYRLSFGSDAHTTDRVADQFDWVTRGIRSLCRGSLGVVVKRQFVAISTDRDGDLR